MDGGEFIRTYMPLRPTIRQVCMTLLSSVDEAEDLTQEVLLQLWERRDELDAITSPKAYVIRISQNKCIDLLRTPAHRLNNDAEPTELDISATSPTPQEELVAEEARVRLNTWLQTLSPQMQRIWRLRHEEMLTNGEVAARVGLQEVTIRSMISRLRKEAKQLFANS